GLHGSVARSAEQPGLLRLWRIVALSQIEGGLLEFPSADRAAPPLNHVLMFKFDAVRAEHAFHVASHLSRRCWGARRRARADRLKLRAHQASAEAPSSS